MWATRFRTAYAKTPAFYLGAGFRPHEELGQIWDERNPYLVTVKRIRTLKAWPGRVVRRL